MNESNFIIMTQKNVLKIVSGMEDVTILSMLNKTIPRTQTEVCIGNLLSKKDIACSMSFTEVESFMKEYENEDSQLRI